MLWKSYLQVGLPHTRRSDSNERIDPVLIAHDEAMAVEAHAVRATTALLTETVKKPGWDWVIQEERGFTPEILTTRRRAVTRESRDRSEAL